mmetsp:Transcript_34475/g.91004  ORF Transcript_34475/g.91004 Transcript_34475/m.91004 type:complete len:111 (+) Transcript_34475:128-460(+)
MQVKKEVHSATNKVDALSPSSSVDDESDTLKKMKASVHAAAIIKKKAALHAIVHGSTKAKASADQQPSWFDEGPYFIAGLLATILLAFCYCAFSSQPTSMSGKYDLRSRV